MIAKKFESKIQIPNIVKYHVPRKELREKICEQGERVILIHAGTGFGKTMLLSEIARHADRCCWYQMSVNDNDAGIFLQGIIKSIQQAVTEFVFYQEKMHGWNHSIDGVELMAMEFCIALCEQIKQPLMIALDDFQELHSEAVTRFLEVITQEAPEGIQLLIASRGSFPQWMAPYVIQGRLMSLDSRDLAFTLHDTKILLQQVLQKSIEERVAHMVFTYTEGWPAGVMFTVLAMRQNPHWGDIGGILKDSEIYSYIAFKIFKLLSYDLQNFLLDTSVLEALSPAICDYVTGRADSKSNLEYLVSENLFTVKLEGGREWYRYHSIFRTFLLDRLAEDKKNAMLERASIYCLRWGEAETGIEYAVRCGNGVLVLDGMNRILDKMTFQGQSETIQRWCSYLEENRIQAPSRLWYRTYQFYSGASDTEKARYYLEKAVEEAYTNKEYQEFGKYSELLFPMVREQDGILMAKYRLDFAFQFLEGHMCVSYPALVLFRLQTYLELGQNAEAADCCQFYCRKSEEYGIQFLQLRWVLPLLEQVLKDEVVTEQILERIEECLREAPVIAEFVYYIYSWKKYEEGNCDILCDCLEHGIRGQSGSVFCHWMKLLLILINCSSGVITEAQAADELQATERFCEKQQLGYPILKEKEYALLNRLLEQRKKRCLEPNMNCLRAVCFGDFAVYGINKEELVWRTKKTKELFAYLLEQQGRIQDKDTLMGRLWPESNARSASTLLNTNVSYLRRALAAVDCEQVLVVEKKQYSLRMESITSDYDEFLRLCQLVEKKQWTMVEKSRSITDIYQGTYLKDMDFIWMAGKREYLEQLFLKTCGRLGEHYVENKEHLKAISLIQSALAVDPYSRDLTILLIECMCEMGDMKKAKSLYERTCALWKEELGQELGIGLENILEKQRRLDK